MEDRLDESRESTSRLNGNVTAAAGRSGYVEVRALATQEVKASGVRFGRFRVESNSRGGTYGSMRRISLVLQSWLGPVCSVDSVCLVDEPLRLSARSPRGPVRARARRVSAERCHLQGSVPTVPARFIDSTVQLSQDANEARRDDAEAGLIVRPGRIDVACTG